MNEIKNAGFLRTVLAMALGITLAFPAAKSAQIVDSDNDGMSDDWEVVYDFDPADPLDAGGDTDMDGLAALSEFQKGTDPTVADTDRDGFLDGADNAPLSRVFIEWGSPAFTKGDDYRYPAPSWFVGAFQKEGRWKLDEKPGWQGGYGEGAMPSDGRVVVVVNPEILEADLVVEVELEDEPGGELYAGLLDGNGGYVEENLAGNLVSGLGGEKKALFKAPFTMHEDAVAFSLHRKGGKVTIYRTMAYVDDDGDGLDREQEEQLGTSDKEKDSDGDGIGDFDEVFKHKTDPSRKDTDLDGMPDGWEIAHKLNPLLDDSREDGDGDGRANFKEYIFNSDPNAGQEQVEAVEPGLVVGTPLEKEPLE